MVPVDTPDSTNTHEAHESDSGSSSKSLKLNEVVRENSFKPSRSTESKQFEVDALFKNQQSFKDGVKAEGMLNRILFMIAKDQMPYSCVEKIGFRTVLNYAAPLYKIPSRTTITQKMELKYGCLSNIVKEDLAKVKYISLTTDAWSDSMNNVGYLGLTCHFIENFELKSINIGVKELDNNHTSDNLKNWLLEMVENWNINIESIVGVVSDNAYNITRAVKDAFGEDKYLDCLAHTMNLVPSAVLTSDDINLKDLKPILSKVKDIVRFFKQSNNASDKLRKVTEDRLIQSVETRWNSDYDMLERFIRLSQYVAPILLELPKSPPMLSAEELQIVKELVVLLKPFYNATNIVSGEKYLTGSQAIPIIKILEREIDSSCVTSSLGVNVQTKLKQQFKKRFEHIDKKTSIAMATLMDPRFKKLYFTNKVACADAVNRIAKHLHNLHANSVQESERVEDHQVESESGDDFWSYHQKLLDDTRINRKENQNLSQMPEQLRFYFSQLPIAKDCDPLLFWKMHPDSCLTDLAMRYLTIIATSVPCERLFSTAGMIMNQERNRLTPEHFQQLLFLNLLPLKYWKI